MQTRMVTDGQAKELAELYVWDAVVSILEGSTAPRTRYGVAAAKRVLKICREQKSRLMTSYDRNASLSQKEQPCNRDCDCVGECKMQPMDGRV